MRAKKKIPLTFKWIFSIFMLILIPAYWIGYGPANFLWGSDIILALAFLATVFESRFLASMAASGGFLFSVFWIIDFLFTLIMILSGSALTGATIYVFNTETHIWLRILTLYHAALPPLLLWLIYRLGYSQKAWLLQVLLSWIAVLTAWFVTDPSRNINLAHLYETVEWLDVGAIPYLIGECFLISLIIASSHLLIKTVQKKFF